MKKIVLCLVLILTGLFVTGCNFVNDGAGEDEVIKVIMPTGTPALALSEYAMTSEEKGVADVEVVGGSEPLKAAFVNSSHDIIVAPVNLGAMMYKAYGEYILYKTFVWGNLYVASKGNISSLEDLNNKTVVVFGKNSTPDIVFQAILKNNPDLKVNIQYAADVAEANALLVSNKAEIVISAEPALSNLKNKFNLSIIDLQDVWKDMTGSSSYPQAGIFVKKSSTGVKEVKDALALMKTSIENAIKDPARCAEYAVNFHSSFANLGKDVLVKSIPNCHYQLLESDKDAVLYYLQTMMDLGFGKQMGSSLPDDEFFY